VSVDAPARGPLGTRQVLKPGRRSRRVGSSRSPPTQGKARELADSGAGWLAGLGGLGLGAKPN